MHKDPEMAELYKRYEKKAMVDKQEKIDIYINIQWLNDVIYKDKNGAKTS